MVLDIVTNSNPKLKEKSIDVKIGTDLTELIRNMFETNGELKGVGIAAPQVGENINLFLIDYKDFQKVFINPVVTQINEKKSTLVEGCLSIPDYNISVDRYEIIRVDYYNRKYEFLQEFYYGYVARIIQHEMDHLNGILISDRKKGQ